MNLLRFLVDAIFPMSCLSCKTNGTYLCAACLKQIPRETGILYSSNSIPSFSMRDKSPRPYGGGFYGIIPAVNYKNTPVVQKAIHLLKYRRIRAFAKPLGELLHERVIKFIRANPKNWLIITVPLHARKLRSRGFNQNDLLAEAAFADSKISLAIKKQNPLKRIRDTKSQTELNGARRLLNVKNSFAVTDIGAIQGRSIILIDDVLTTGATILSAGNALITVGAREVWGAVVARD